MVPVPLPPEGDALRVVLDTNVVLSLWHFRSARMIGLLAWLDARGASLLTRDDCLDELTRVLAFSDFGIAPERRAEIAAHYRARTELIAPRATTDLPRCKDRDDQKFLELAWAGGAHLLLTRDKLLLAMARVAPWSGRTHIVTPERLLKVLEAPLTSGDRDSNAVRRASPPRPRPPRMRSPRPATTSLPPTRAAAFFAVLHDVAL